MRCPNCNAPLDENTAFCGNCGKQIVPVQAQGATVVSPVEQRQWFDRSSASVGNDYATQLSASPRPSVQAPPNAGPFGIPVPSETPQPPLQPAPRRTNPRLIALLVALVILIIAGGTVAILATTSRNNNAAQTNAGGNNNAGKNTNPGNVAAATTTGTVAFVDNPKDIPGHTDALKITVNSLKAPPSGSQYDAWLVNEQSEQSVALGTLTANGSTFSLSYAGDGKNGGAGTNLIGAGNKLEVTQEQGTVTSPVGKVILAGTFPPQAFVHIRHLLFSFPTTPGKIGLLVGLQDQAQLLNAQALILQSVASGQDTSVIQCAALSIIDIVEGTKGANYKPLQGWCAGRNITAIGDGFGILGNTGYAATAAQHASLAATRPDSTDLIRLHAGHVQIATTNIKGWVTTVDQDALNLLNNPSDTTKVQEIVTLSDHAFHGVDIDGDERVDPVPGEAGAITAYIHGQLMAGLPLVAGA